jgi:hypothetical protein
MKAAARCPTCGMFSPLHDPDDARCLRHQRDAARATTAASEAARQRAEGERDEAIRKRDADQHTAARLLRSAADAGARAAAAEGLCVAAERVAFVRGWSEVADSWELSQDLPPDAAALCFAVRDARRALSADEPGTAP